MTDGDVLQQQQDKDKIYYNKNEKGTRCNEAEL